MSGGTNGSAVGGRAGAQALRRNAGSTTLPTSPNPAIGAVNSPSHGQNRSSALRRHFGIRRPNPQGLAEANTASVTQLASSQLSINNAPRHPEEGCGDVPIPILLPRLGNRSRFAHPVRRTEAGVPGAVLVEVNGFEPMTSCLQSRRSPS